jgi:hypothetical protein
LTASVRVSWTVYTAAVWQRPNQIRYNIIIFWDVEKKDGPTILSELVLNSNHTDKIQNNALLCFSNHSIGTAPVFFDVLFKTFDPIAIIPGRPNHLSDYMFVNVTVLIEV